MYCSKDSELTAVCWFASGPAAVGGAAGGCALDFAAGLLAAACAGLGGPLLGGRAGGCAAGGGCCCECGGAAAALAAGAPQNDRMCACLMAVVLLLLLRRAASRRYHCSLKLCTCFNKLQQAQHNALNTTMYFRASLNVGALESPPSLVAKLLGEIPPRRIRTHSKFGGLCNNLPGESLSLFYRTSQELHLRGCIFPPYTNLCRLCCNNAVGNNDSC